MDKVWNSVFEKFKGLSFKVRYWDGEEALYGPEPPAFTLVFHAKPSITSIAADPTLTLGEQYMEGRIDFEGDLDSVFRLVHLNPPERHLGERMLSAAGKGLKCLKNVARQKENIKAHYDLGNDFFSLWLDETMCYSCAYFRHDGQALHTAQLQKIDLTLKKLRLKPGQKLLDIGCGWGWLIMRAAQKYGARAVGITLSEEQHAEATRRIAAAGLAGQVEVRLVNYLELDEGSFDAVVSIGMFEHVGRECFRDYFQKVADFLKPGGVTLLHTLTSQSETETNGWVKKYIFPGGYIPSVREVVGLMPDYDFHLVAAESLRRHYVKTLEMWYENFSQPETLEKVARMFDDRFIRMWTLYLIGAASSLRTGHLDIHQFLMTKGVNNEMPMTLEDIYADW